MDHNSQKPESTASLNLNAAPWRDEAEPQSTRAEKGS